MEKGYRDGKKKILVLDGMAAFFFSGRLRLFRREKGDGGRKRNIGGISVEWDDL